MSINWWYPRKRSEVHCIVKITLRKSPFEGKSLNFDFMYGGRDGGKIFTLLTYEIAILEIAFPLCLFFLRRV